MKKRYFSLNWNFVLLFALVVGILLRVTFVNDMEYKEDEEYNFTQTQLIGVSKPWPWYGIPSGVYLVNPGMSIWVFTILAKLFGIHTPTSLAHAVQLFALFGMALVIPFAYRMIQDQQERKTWLWAFLLAMVNPFLVLYQRKLWPEPFLPFFTMTTLMGWWKRETRIGALVWGLVGACIGQVHMSGFFFAFALFLWTSVFDQRRSQVKWKFWLLGSVIGALPLIPWLLFILQNPVGGTISIGWNEILQFKYWAFWFTDPTGLHLGNPLGLLRGPSNLDQISDFIRYPLLFGNPTYLVGVAHFTTLIAVILIFYRGLTRLWEQRKNLGSVFIGRESATSFVQNATLWGCGLFMTATGIMIRRYYMTVTFPLEFILLVRMARPQTRIGHSALILLFASELFISAHFVGYIHVNAGSIWGDYGKAYHLIQSEKLKADR